MAPQAHDVLLGADLGRIHGWALESRLAKLS
jgi:hypothetical protein